jgi:dihydroflavonol-4-reductase
VLGPLVRPRDTSGSTQVVHRLLAGQFPLAPPIDFSIVDVRDVAELHWLCLTRPEAAGQRFIASVDKTSLPILEIGKVLGEAFPAHANKLPTRTLPTFALKAMSWFDAGVREMLPHARRHIVISSSKAQDVLGWKSRDLNQTLLDTARSIIDAGVV